LKPGHIPPDHKVESFIRSKYESRRWALEGSPPEDPTTLQAQNQNQNPTSGANQQTSASIAISSHNQRSVAEDTISGGKPTQPIHALLSSNHSSQPGEVLHGSQTAIQNKPAEAKQDDLFSLDFSMPSSAAIPAPAQSKELKQGILSLYDSNSKIPSDTHRLEQLSNAGPVGLPLRVSGAQHPIQRPDTITAFANNPWTAAPSPGLHGSGISTGLQASLSQSSIWNTDFPLGSGSTSSPSAPQPSQKKDDIFGDLWAPMK